jgi:hypothetical protein
MSKGSLGFWLPEIGAVDADTVVFETVVARILLIALRNNPRQLKKNMNAE